MQKVEVKLSNDAMVYKYVRVCVCGRVDGGDDGE